MCIRTSQRKGVSFLSLLRERALCALYLYSSLDIQATSLHNWVESLTNPRYSTKEERRNTETQKIRDDVHADTS